jgi:hypothetical protein
VNNGLFGFPIGKRASLEGGFGWPLRMPLPRPLPRAQSFGIVLANTNDSVFSSGAGANAKGTWAEVAVTEFWVDYISLKMRANLNNVSYLVDIGIGPAGAEEVVVENLLMSGAGTGGGASSSSVYPMLPVSIPPGTRVVMRSQCTTGATSLSYAGMLLGTGEVQRQSGRRVENAGGLPATSLGTSIDPGGSANTKPTTFTTLLGETTIPWDALVVAIGNNNNGARTTGWWAIDIAVGPPGGEEIILPDLSLVAVSTNDWFTWLTWAPWPCRVPVGSRISARAQSSITDATDRLFGLAVYGLQGH